MARKIIALIGLLLLAGVGTMLVLTVQRAQKEQGMSEQVQSLSALTQHLGVSLAGGEEHTLIVVFNSTCEHCQWEISHLEENRAQLAKVRLMFLSWEPEMLARDYLAEHQLEDYYMAVDEDRLLTAFDGGYPQLYLYNGNELVESFTGEVKIELLLAAMGKS